MSSKVVHLADEAHSKAKAFCKANGLKMSDWVASLIEAAIQSGGHLPRLVPPMLQQPVAPAPAPAPSPAPASEPPARRPVAAAARPTPSPSAVRPSAATTTTRAAVAHGANDSNGKVRSLVPKKKLFEGEADQAGAKKPEDDVPPWAAPPFWAQGK